MDSGERTSPDGQELSAEDRRYLDAMAYRLRRLRGLMEKVRSTPGAERRAAGE